MGEFVEPLGRDQSVDVVLAQMVGPLLVEKVGETLRLTDSGGLAVAVELWCGSNVPLGNGSDGRGLVPPGLGAGADWVERQLAVPEVVQVLSLLRVADRTVRALFLAQVVWR
ncbi:hypothetical protein ACWEKM_27615 [Streptomyces sp. NPDC004752]